MRLKKMSFWKTKTLEEMTRSEWESLCDNCGRCCVEKLEDKKTGKVFFTNVACRFLDLQKCRCTSYENRKAIAPWCLILTPQLVPMIRWLPKSCAYRVISEKRELAWWHPLVSGDLDSVHRAGISVSGKVISSEHVHPDDLANFIVDWKVWKDLGAGLPGGETRAIKSG
jgi:uncharacterized cysteine cluster protein YcgN (CxxCxxCC family)